MFKKFFYTLFAIIVVCTAGAQDFKLSSELRYSPVYSRGFRASFANDDIKDTQFIYSVITVSPAFFFNK